MAWRKLEDTFHSDRKIRKLARALDIIEPYAAGHLVTLWSWALLHAPDGDLTKFDEEDIEYAAKWSGQPGILLNACVKTSLIDRTEDGKILLHNWIKRGGSYAESRRKRLERQEKNQCPGLSGIVQDSPEMSALEEKRREENIYTCGESTADAADVLVVSKSTARRDDIDAVWQHYRTHHPKAPRALRSKRREYRLVRDRLADFTVDELKQAIDGYHRSPWHNGANDRGKRYLALDLILRDITHVQQGLELAEPRNGNGTKRLLDTSLGDG